MLLQKCLSGRGLHSFKKYLCVEERVGKIMNMHDFYLNAMKTNVQCVHWFLRQQSLSVGAGYSNSQAHLFLNTLFFTKSVLGKFWTMIRITANSWESNCGKQILLDSALWCSDNGHHVLANNSDVFLLQMSSLLNAARTGRIFLLETSQEE